MANHSDPNLRDPKRAVELAPQSTWAWQCLGWVQYRAGKWKASIAALELSDKLQEGGTGDAFQWLFLAMAQRQLGDRGAANRWYDKAAQTEQVLPEELRCFQAEAEQLLGVNAGNKDIAILGAVLILRC